jgi:hypothetical protein
MYICTCIEYQKLQFENIYVQVHIWSSSGVFVFKKINFPSRMQRVGVAYCLHSQFPSLLALLYNTLNIVTKIKYTNFNKYLNIKKDPPTGKVDDD